MRRITALLHTRNDALCLGRALETIHPCDEILIVDHGSQDATLRIAREYAARIISGSDNDHPSSFLQQAGFDWIFCLEPRESMSDALAASLFEWKTSAWPDEAHGFNISLSEETIFPEMNQEMSYGWIDLATPQTRLIHKNQLLWQACLPAFAPSAPLLEGRLLRFMLPGPRPKNFPY